jgi:hypothetical protein
MAWLNGKKTYIVSAVSIIAAWIGVWAGTVDFAAAWQLTQTAVLGSTLRAGIAAK